MNKSFRQGQILRLINSRRIHTQEQLAQELAGVGVATTQVTLSRDMRELRLAKTPEGYRQVDARPPGPDVDTVVSEFLREVRLAQNQVVLKTPPGHANVLAVALDQSNWPEIVGTVAGDDTVLVIAPDNETAEALRERLLGLMTA
jgi:transcriptional regulator of arginine metabolism